MAYADLTISRHVVLDTGNIYFWDNENTNTLRTGLSWAAAWRDGEGTPGAGKAAFVKATDTPYRMVFNVATMADETIYFDCTGNGFERGAKKADFRSSDLFTWSVYDSVNNVYSATVPDVLTGEREGLYGLDYDGHYLFNETLNFEGAWGVWQVVGTGANETVTPLTRVLDYGDIAHGNWHWDNGTLYVKWDGTFDDAEFEVIQRAKAFELWTDGLPESAYRSGAVGIKSRFGLFGHQNGGCIGWRAADCEFAWNALDGMGCIAANGDRANYSLYTQVYRCHIHHNFRNGITNMSHPAGAMPRGEKGGSEVCADYCYIHDNGDAGVYLHRQTRWNQSTSFSDYPFIINNCTIINNARGVALTDEQMLDTIATFGYDTIIPATWESYSWQDKVDYWNTKDSGNDTGYVRLRNNLIYNNDENLSLIDDTWPGTTWVVDSDYNDIYPAPESWPWSEGAHSLSIEPEFTEVPRIVGTSALVDAGTAPFQYPTDAETTQWYYTHDSAPYDSDYVNGVYNIGCSFFGYALVSLQMARHMPSFDIATKVFQIPDGTDYVLVSEISARITTDVPYVSPEGMVSVEIYEPSISGFYYSDVAQITFSGVAASLMGSISEVSWENDKGQSGVASGTASWSFDVDLYEGTSNFTITAVNEYGDHQTIQVEVYGSVEKAVLTAVGINTGAPVVGVPELTALDPFGYLSRYLPEMDPDYAGGSLSLAPNEVIQGRGRFKQIVHETDGGTRSVITLSTTPRFYVTLKWSHLSQADFDALFDFYFNPSKALGIARSFIWTHPVENADYVVRFETKFPFDYHAADYYAVSGITFRVLGVAA